MKSTNKILLPDKIIAFSGVVIPSATKSNMKIKSVIIRLRLCCKIVNYSCKVKIENKNSRLTMKKNSLVGNLLNDDDHTSSLSYFTLTGLVL